MPIDVKANLVKLRQHEFADIAYKVVREAFSVHDDLGSMFDEKVYQNALAARLENVQTEVRIDISFRDFSKSYFMDAVVSNGAIFELKAVEALNTRHKNQLLNYLLLTEQKHGKLINFRPEQIEHEFVNTSLTHNDRTCFTVCDDEWMETEGFGENVKIFILEMIWDWGTGLDRLLYEEALFHFLGGQDQLLTEIDVWQSGICVARQTVPLCGERNVIRLTTFQDDEQEQRFLRELKCLAHATRLKTIQWINISRKKVVLKTLHFSVPNISVHQNKNNINPKE